MKPSSNAKGKKSDPSGLLSMRSIQSLKSRLSDDTKDILADPAVFHATYLGKQGALTLLLKGIATVSSDQRVEFGRELNVLKQMCEEHENKLKNRVLRQRVGSSMTDRTFDVTAPFGPNTDRSTRPDLLRGKGTLHPLTSIGEQAVRIFESMGFHVVESRRLDDDYNVFEALNIPKGHPARDLWDTFWTEDGLIPIPHTSAMQNRIISTVKPPIREIIVGKCFRNEATDASHEHTFYQLEGVYVDRNVTLSDLIGTLSAFANAFYGKDVKYKIQPSYFPFVEPALEFLIECLVCGQVGCPFCKYTGWIEVIPCGPIHPAVLREGGLDPEEYTGFAWGLGYDRLVMLRNSITDIRYLHCGDLKFLEQFV
jgi:phenylalanyl-tRNA synthetase alpha chain